MKNKFYLSVAAWCILFSTYSICEVTYLVSNPQDAKQLEEAQAKRLREAQERQLREVKEKQLREAQEKELKEGPIKRARRIRAATAAIVAGTIEYYECYNEDPRTVNNPKTALRVAGLMVLGGLADYYIGTYFIEFMGYDPASIW